MTDTIPHSEADACFDAVPIEEWPIYLEGIRAVQQAGVEFAIGGGVAYGSYAHRLRYTKDIDLFIRPADRDRAVEAIRSVGFTDLFDEKPYERHWIFRGTRNGQIIDIIWQMANCRTEVDNAWVTRGPLLSLHGTQVRLLPVEEMIWGKLYVIQRERCDWTDIWNVFARYSDDIDWNYLVRRVDTDLPLLAGALQVYGWFAPALARKIPEHVWTELGIPVPRSDRTDLDRVRLLDSRAWFGANGEPCEQLDGD